MLVTHWLACAWVFFGHVRLDTLQLCDKTNLHEDRCDLTSLPSQVTMETITSGAINTVNALCNLAEGGNNQTRVPELTAEWGALEQCDASASEGNIRIEMKELCNAIEAGTSGDVCVKDALDVDGSTSESDRPRHVLPMLSQTSGPVPQNLWVFQNAVASV